MRSRSVFGAERHDMVRRLRVAIYAPQFSEYSYRLAAALAGHCDVRLVLNRKDGNRAWNLVSFSPAFPFKTRIRDLSLRRSGLIEIPGSFVDILGFRPDIVHCHEGPDYYTAALIELLRLFGTPLVLTVHDTAPHSDGGSGTNFVEEKLRSRMRSAAEIVTLHGQSCIEEFRRMTPDFRGHITSAMHGVLMVPPVGTPPVLP